MTTPDRPKRTGVWSLEGIEPARPWEPPFGPRSRPWLAPGYGGETPAVTPTADLPTEPEPAVVASATPAVPAGLEPGDVIVVNDAAFTRTDVDPTTPFAARWLIDIDTRTVLDAPVVAEAAAAEESPREARPGWLARAIAWARR